MRSANIRQTVILIGLTLVYLVFELGFNARLLDVVGSTAPPEDIEAMEVAGRTLSGVAAALVTLQLLWGRRLRKGRPGWIVIPLASLSTGAAVYVAIAAGVDILVATRSAEERRIAVTSQLLRGAVAGGHLQLDRVADDAVFTRPEGKAFLALFQLLLPAVDRFEEKIARERPVLLRATIAREVVAPYDFDGATIRATEPGLLGYFEIYSQVMEHMARKWRQYDKLPVAGSDGLTREQDKAWRDYEKRLARFGWTPESVPPARQDRVARDVRKRVGVPAGWHPADRVTFDEAVARRYESSVRTKSPVVEGDTIPLGLSYDAFIARPGIQRLLRKALLGLPESVRVAPVYGSNAAFSALYEAWLTEKVRQRDAQFKAHLREFERGGRLMQHGEDAMRAAVVSAVALLCSLIGAILHFSKLLYLCAQLLLWWRAVPDAAPSLRTKCAASMVWVLAAVLTWVSFSLRDNDVTRSELFTQMTAFGTGPDAGVGGCFAANVAHVIVVGQAYTYPLNETLRRHVLRGLNYGYRGDDA